MPRTVISRIGSSGYKSERESTDEDAARLAEMLILQAAPRVSTDSTFMAGYATGHNDGLVGESAMPFRLKYKEATGSMPDGKFYCSQIAEYPGDPKAWIGSKGDLVRRCKERGVGWQGAVNIAAPERPPEKEVTADTYTCAPDIVHKRMVEMEMANPGSVSSLTKKEKADLKEKVTKIASGRE